MPEQYLVSPEKATRPGWQKRSHGSLGISLSNQNATGDRLISIVKWMQSNFEFVIIDLSDTLYRWNMRDANGNVGVEAFKQARAAGDRWLEENQAIFSITQASDGKQKSPPVVLRWDYWFLNPEYNSTIRAVKDLYNLNENFYKAVEEDVARFLKRANRLGQVIDDNLRSSCLSYILEEVAVHTLLARKIPPNELVQLYPGSALQASNIIRKGKIPEAPEGLEKVIFVPLRIDEKQSLLPDLTKKFNPETLTPR